MKLNLGCGDDIKEGFYNVDKRHRKGVDLIFDLNKKTWPFKTNSVDYIYCKDILEHLDDMHNSMNEISRILKPGGKVFITMPHYTSPDAWGDPEHTRPINSKTFYHFKHSFKNIKVYIHFVKNIFTFYNFLVEFLVNLNEHTRFYYEVSFLNLFPAQNVEVILVK